MDALIERWRRRATSNQGSVGILMALVMFFVCGMLIMTWNTYTLSREKMRLQNAADAAAIEFAVWQARGMNTIQNMNDEAYDVLTVAITGYTIGAGAAAASVAVNVVPVVGQVLSAGLVITSVLVSDVSTWMMNLVLPFIRITQDFWLHGTPFIAYISAQQAAAMNGATGVISHFIGKDPISFKLSSVVNFSLDLHAIGISLSPKDTFFLPLERVKKNEGDMPWKPDKKLQGFFKTLRATPVVGKSVWLPSGTVRGFDPVVSKKRKATVKKTSSSTDSSKDATTEKKGSTWSAIKGFFTGDKKDAAADQGQEIELSDMSKKDKAKDTEKKEDKKEETVAKTDGKEVKLLPAPTLWICLRDYPSHDSIKSFDEWLFEKAGKDFGSLDNPGKSPFPIMAYAVGQCVTGDVIENTPDDTTKVNKIRARGWGAGANAKLISLEEALTITDHPILRRFAGLIFYH